MYSFTGKVNYPLTEHKRNVFKTCDGKAYVQVVMEMEKFGPRFGAQGEPNRGSGSPFGTIVNRTRSNVER